jgi:hypothetical protein
LPGVDRTGIAAAHSDHRVGLTDGLAGERLGELLLEIDPDLTHRLDDGRVDLVGWRAPRERTRMRPAA